MADKIMLLDGNSLINRAYYGLNNRNPLTAPDGTPTGALYAFMNMLSKYMEEIKPEYACAAFDLKEPTFRHKAYDQYKGTRKPMPDDLAIQIPLLKNLLDSLGMPRLEIPGYEADDILGTMADKAAKAGFEVVIITGDKDSFQLVSDSIKVLQPLTRGGKSDTQIVDVEYVKNKYLVDPKQLIDIKAIMGDPSDNIPGVKGIGEKGAISLISKYGSLDEVYEHLDDITSSQAKKLAESKEMAYLSLQLAEICLDVPLDSNILNWKIKKIDKASLLEQFRQYGFKSLIEKFNLRSSDGENYDSFSGDEQVRIPDHVMIVDKSDFLSNIEQNLLIDEKFLIALKSVNDDNYLFSLYDPLKSYKDITDGKANAKDIVISRKNLCFFCSELDKTVNDKTSIIVFDYKSFLKISGINPFSINPHDTMIAGYLLNQIDGKPDFARLYQQATGDFWQASDEVSNQPVQLSLSEAIAGTISSEADGEEQLTDSGDRTYQESELKDAIRYCDALAKIFSVQKSVFDEDEKLSKLMFELEIPLTKILFEMERHGFLLDSEELNSLSASMQKEIDLLQAQIYDLSGESFNLNSPKQLGQVLFERLGLKTGKKRSGGNFSTDADELERLKNEHPVIELIIAHRQVSKLKSTFVDGLSKLIAADRRVHTTFSQVLTSTGRLSSSEPNLQNIPIRREAGAQIRKVFVAAPEHILLDADYSQIELRLLAHLSQDKAMLEAFTNDQDIHMNTACSIFNLPPEMINSDQRAIAKTVNFSIVYGISDFGLARDLGVTVKEAHEYIKNYNEQYPGVRRYLDGLIENAHEKGYVETMSGRRRYITELKSTNRNVRMFGERAAMNAPVQGTAADLIKTAMVKVSSEFRRNNMKSALILQVHDELIVEAPVNEADQAAVILQQAMESAAALSVPLIAEVHRGYNWSECK